MLKYRFYYQIDYIDNEEQAKDLLSTMKLINAITSITGGIN